MTAHRNRTTEHTARLLEHADRLLANGEDLASVCRTLGIPESSFHRTPKEFTLDWKKLTPDGERDCCTKPD